MSDNIHVAIRVRPLIKREVEKNAEVCWDTKDSTVIYQRNSPSCSYTFDRVFNMEDSNVLVYQDLCAPIVRSVMEGFNGTIFAYGQTSSGKTYTMMGEYGIIPSAIHDIFDAIDNMPEREFLLRISYMEIYNENVLDLLSNDPKNLKTLEDTDGVILVAGLEEEEIKTSEEVFRIMKRGERRRRVGDTQMNERSSRSHAIFRMIIESRMRNTDEDSVVNVGQLNLVDLAGSERSGQMGITGERFREGININKSLLMLTHVISQLSKGDKQHVSYRDSKLTRILQNSLGGNALTVIICTVTPASIQETLSTLKFASRAKRIKNKPMANIVSNDKALLKRYTNEIKKLSEQLEALQQMGDDGKQEILVKELEEKSKQNEDLKQLIQDLKEKFVVSQLTTDRSAPILSKKVRRETWCGGLSGLKRLKSQSECGLGMLNPLPILQEEPLNSSSIPEFFDFEFVDIRERFSSTISPLSECQYSKASTEVAIQTEDVYFSKEKSLVEKLRITQEEYKELQEFTTREKQTLEVFNTEEIKLLKVKNQELEVKLTEYDVLLQENSKQRNRINDMSQQIEKLAEQNHDLQTISEQQPLKISNDEDSPGFTSPLFHDTGLSVFQEIQQLSEPKLYRDTSIQTDESKTCLGTQETAMQAEVENDAQTIQTHQIATQTDDDYLSDLKKEYLENPNLTGEKPYRFISTDDMKSVEQNIEGTLSQYNKFLSDIQSLSSSIKSIEVYDFVEANDFPLTERHAFMSHMLEKHSQLRDEKVISELEHALKIIKMDNDYGKEEITRLEKLCKEKDEEVKVSADKLRSAKQKLSQKENDLKTWQDAASEKYDLYLSILKEKGTLHKHLKELENTIANNKKFVNGLTEKITCSDSRSTKLKEELLDTLKSLEIAKQEFVIKEGDLHSQIRVQELDKNKLSNEILTLKEQSEAFAEHYKQVIEDTKTNYERKIAALEARMKRNYEDKLSDLQTSLNDQHQLESEDLKSKLQNEMLSRANTYKLEKLKFEEELLASNRDYVQKNVQYLSQVKQILSEKEAECKKLKLALENRQMKAPSDSKTDGGSVSHLNKQLEIKQRELIDHQTALSKMQQRWELAEANAKSEKKVDVENFQKLEKKNQQLETLIKDQESMIKQHSSKFSTFKVEFEKEYIKLKTERDGLSQKTKLLETEVSQLKKSSAENKQDASVDKSMDTTSKAKDADSSIQKTLENKQLQHRCKKLEQERNLLYQKLGMCKNEIRRLHDVNNESKIVTKCQPELKSPSSASLSSNLHFQTLVNQKERCIIRLEKENKKYRDYLSTKGHHKIVQEATKVSEVNKENTATPQSSKTTENRSIPQSVPADEISFSTPSGSVDRAVPKTDEKKKPPHQSDSVQKGWSSVTKSTVVSDLDYDHQNCKQQ